MRAYIVQRRRCSREEPCPANAYSGPEDFARDLRLMQQSLHAYTGERLNELLLDPLLRQVSVFGFHLQNLDIRQHARVHAKAIDELAGMLPSHGKTKPEVEISPQTQDLLQTLSSVAELKRHYSQAIEAYGVSGTQGQGGIWTLIPPAGPSGVHVATA